MAWACMAANGTGSLVFIDDVTADKSSRMNSEVFWAILSAPIQPNASELIGQRFTVQMDKNKQELKTVAVEAWQSITRDETQCLVMSMRSRLQAVIDCKGFATKFSKVKVLICDC